MDYDAMQAKVEELARDRAAGHAVTWTNERLQGPDRAGEILERIESETIDPGDLPSPDLSGQWADDPAPWEILAEVGYPGDRADETAMALIDAYELEYALYVEYEITRILTGHADEDSLQRLEGLSVSDLDTMADACYSPDTHESAGAEVLTLARDTVVEKLRDRMRVESETLSETVHAVQDDMPGEVAAESPDDSHGVWAQFVDLGAWTEDVQGLYDPAASTALEDAARAAVGEIVSRLTWAILMDVLTD